MRGTLCCLLLFWVAALAGGGDAAYAGFLRGLDGCGLALHCLRSLQPLYLPAPAGIFSSACLLDIFYADCGSARTLYCWRRDGRLRALEQFAPDVGFVCWCWRAWHGFISRVALCVTFVRVWHLCFHRRAAGSGWPYLLPAVGFSLPYTLLPGAADAWLSTSNALFVLTSSAAPVSITTAACCSWRTAQRLCWCQRTSLHALLVPAGRLNAVEPDVRRTGLYTTRAWNVAAGPVTRRWTGRLCSCLCRSLFMTPSSPLRRVLWRLGAGRYMAVLHSRLRLCSTPVCVSHTRAVEHNAFCRRRPACAFAGSALLPEHGRRARRISTNGLGALLVTLVSGRCVDWTLYALSTRLNGLVVCGLDRTAWTAPLTTARRRAGLERTPRAALLRGVHFLRVVVPVPALAGRARTKSRRAASRR